MTVRKRMPRRVIGEDESDEQQDGNAEQIAGDQGHVSLRLL